MISSGQLTVPFDLVHVDVHADMGMGDCSCTYIICELLYEEVPQHSYPRLEGFGRLVPGNFISFGLACRWIKHLTYVHHPQMAATNCGLHDIPSCMFEANNPRSPHLQLKLSPRERDGDCVWNISLRSKQSPLWQFGLSTGQTSKFRRIGTHPY